MNYNFYVPGTTMDSYTIFMLVIPIILIGIFYYIDPFHIKKHYQNAYTIIILLMLFTLGSLFLLKKKFYPTPDGEGGGDKAQELIKKLFITLGVFIGGFYLGGPGRSGGDGKIDSGRSRRPKTSAMRVRAVEDLSNRAGFEIAKSEP